jgi:ADP-glucose type glycogen/starch synthase
MKRRVAPQKPKILIVTPEISYVPAGMEHRARTLHVKEGGLADVSASLVNALYDAGTDIHVALPHYRNLFNINIHRLINDELRMYQNKLPGRRVHLAEDRNFYYMDRIYSSHKAEGAKVALAFQREVINNIIPELQPDLIHCNDWLTGLIPAMARRRNIPCLFTVHNTHTSKQTLDYIEDRGIDTAEFFHHLYFERPPHNYEESRSDNPVDFLASGIFASHFINTVSPTFLREIADGFHDFFLPDIRKEITHKHNAGCAMGILNAPDPQYNPKVSPYIPYRYDAGDHAQAKKNNKQELQRILGLTVDADAPVFFWPSRLDPVQKGCQLVAERMYDIISSYYHENLQLVFIANGPFQEVIANIATFHGFHNRVGIHAFDEKLSHMGYAAADFVLMPSLFEPCGLVQMIGCLFGSLPVARQTGGINDTITHLSDDCAEGNGFLFKDYDSNGLYWAITRAMAFYHASDDTKQSTVSRIMQQAQEQFSLSRTAQQYMDLYERMLQRPLLPRF